MSKKITVDDDENLLLKDKLQIYRDVVYGFLFHKLKRNAKLVKSLYQDGLYTEFDKLNLVEFSIKNIMYMDIKDLSTKNKKMVYENNNKLVRNYRHIVMKKWYDEFFSQISPFISKNDEIVELGCGNGRALFALRNYGITNKMSGYEISSNSVNFAQKLDKKFGTNIDFGVSDYTKELQMNLEGKTIFTYMSLEQVKYGLNDAITNIIRAKPKQIIHFEAIHQLINDRFYRMIVNLNRKRKGYQTELLDILQQKDVKITHTKTNKINCSILNPTMMIRYTLN